MQFGIANGINRSKDKSTVQHKTENNSSSWVFSGAKNCDAYKDSGLRAEEVEAKSVHH